MRPRCRLTASVIAIALACGCGDDFTSSYPKDGGTNRNGVAENQASANEQFGIGVSGWYTRDNWLERNRGWNNGIVDLFTEPNECDAPLGNVWQDNQGTKNCSRIR